MLLGAINIRLILGLTYLFIITPIGFILKHFTKQLDCFKLKRKDSYFHELDERVKWNKNYLEQS